MRRGTSVHPTRPRPFRHTGGTLSSRGHGPGADAGAVSWRDGPARSGHFVNCTRSCMKSPSLVVDLTVSFSPEPATLTELIGLSAVQYLLG